MFISVKHILLKIVPTINQIKTNSVFNVSKTVFIEIDKVVYYNLLPTDANK